MPLKSSRKILSDEEMAALEGAPAPKRKILSDDEMNALEVANKDPGEQGLKPGGLSGSTIKSGGAAILDALGGSSDTVLKNIADKMSLGNISQYYPGFRRDLLYQNREFPNSANVGKGAGVIGLGSAAGAVPAMRIGGSLTANLSSPTLAASGGLNVAPALAAAAQGFAEAPGNTKGLRDDLYQRASNIPASAAMGVGGQMLGSAAGAAGDSLMQRAVGRTKITPGVGEELADQGIWGTRGMMKNQVSGAKKNIYNQMNDMASRANGFDNYRNSTDVANGVRKIGNNIDFGETTSSLDRPTLNSIESAAGDIEGRGWEDPKTMLGRRRAAGDRVPPAGWDKKIPEQALKGAISKAEQQGYSSALKNAIPEIAPLDTTYSALAKAGAGLNKDASLGALPKYGIPGAAAAGGAIFGGAPGAAAAAGLGYLSTTPLGMSSLGRAGVAAGQYSPGISAEAIDALIRKSMKDGEQ